MIGKGFAVFVGTLAMLFALVPRVSFASINPSYDAAMAACQAYSLSGHFGGTFTGEACVLYHSGAVNQVVKVGCSVNYGTCHSSPADGWNRWSFTGDVPPTCPAGQIVPPGTPYEQSSSTGEACTSGANRCEMTLVLGGSSSGSQMLTGAACAASTGDFTPHAGLAPPVPPDPTPDGGRTFCDAISGICVTAAPGDGGPPTAPAAPDGSTDNSSTNTAGTTTTGATTTTTTTTGGSTTNTTNNFSGTTDGGGTGTGSGSFSGSGSSSAATASSSTSTASTPAVASSSSSKCTGGACDVGNADGQMGGMYQSSAETPSTVFSSFAAQVQTSPLIGAATGFFSTAGISGGTCPTWQIPGNKYWGASGFSFDFFCSPGMLALLALAGYLVLAVGAFSAFRIALY